MKVRIKMLLAVFSLFTIIGMTIPPTVSAHLGSDHKNAAEGIYHLLMVLLQTGPLENANLTLGTINGVEYNLGITYAQAVEYFTLLLIFVFTTILMLILWKTSTPKPLIYGMMFVIVSFVVMFAQALFHDVQLNMPSMVFMEKMTETMPGLDPSYYSYPIFANFSDISFTQKSILNSRPDLIQENDWNGSFKELQPHIIYENGTEIKVFHLTFQGIVHEIAPGVYVEGWSFNGHIPGPLIRVNEGDHVRIIVYNNLTGAHTVHWHGVYVPFQDDGFPFITDDPDGIQPGETLAYNFTAEPSGVFWYHCHLDETHHIEMGLYGPLIIAPKNYTPNTGVKEQIIMLGDFNSNMQETQSSSQGPYGQGYFVQDSSPKQAMATDTNSYTINGVEWPLTTPVTVDYVGQKIRLYIYDVGDKIFSFHMHGHSFNVTAIDGFPLKNPYLTDTIDISSGQRYVVEFTANNPGVWPLHDHMGQMTTNGFDLGGALTFIVYKGYETSQYERMLNITSYYINRVRTAEDLGLLMPSPTAFQNAVMMVMSGSSMGGMG